MPRRTKIIATLGPATAQPGVLEKMIAAGVDVVRLNFSHGKPDDHARRIDAVREAARRAGRDVGVFADLQGPKIRIEKFADGFVELEDGQPFTLDAALDESAGDRDKVGITYKEQIGRASCRERG